MSTAAASPSASPSVKPGEPPARSSRLASVEFLRILACFGIVWFHHAGSRPVNLGNPGVSLFLMISIAFLGLDLRRAGTKNLSRRAGRLALIWVAWSAMYAAFNVAKALVAKRSVGEYFDAWMALTGPSIHLWFIVFLLLATILAGLAWPLVRTLHSRGLPLLILAGASIPICALVFESVSTYPLPQWAIGVPSVFFGILLGNQIEGPAWSFRARSVWVGTMVCGAGVTLLLNLDASVPFATLLGGTVLAIGWSMPIPFADAVRHLASLTLGIYLMHIGVGTVLRAYGPELPALMHVAVVFALCAALTAAWKRSPLRVLV